MPYVLVVFNPSGIALEAVPSSKGGGWRALEPVAEHMLPGTTHCVWDQIKGKGMFLKETLGMRSMGSGVVDGADGYGLDGAGSSAHRDPRAASAMPVIQNFCELHVLSVAHFRRAKARHLWGLIYRVGIPTG